MSKNWVVVFITIIMMVVGSIATAGGPCYRVPQATQGAPCGAPMVGPQSNYWGDAPLPGLCGGIIALPFLVCGSLLGGNAGGPCGPPPCGPVPRYAPAQQCAPVQYAPPAQCGPPVQYAPPSCAPPVPQYGPQYRPQYGPPPAGYGYAPPGGPTGIPCIDMLAGFFGGQGSM